MKPFLSPLLFILLLSCNDRREERSADGWLQGSEEEKFSAIEKQLRGFDMAMVETGYRYTELYWAGQDQNWDYANYQLDKIKTAIDNGLIRRPKRAQSAQGFLESAIPSMRAAINKKDTAAFNQGFRVFQASCRSCHIAEKVPFIQSAIPEQRLSPIKFLKE
jgi:hypothetical protein